jgi:FkbM family methyltransferase
MPSISRRAKRIVKYLLGKDLLPRIEVKCQTVRFGSEYGGWDVAVELINNYSVVYSFGVGEDASFDLALIEKYGITIHAFDPTPKSIAWVISQGFPSLFKMHDYGLAHFDGDVSFNPPKNPVHVSHTILTRSETESRSIKVRVKRLSTIVKELHHSCLDLVKMDIEGAEYGVIQDMEESGIRPQQLLVEFHHRFPNVGINKTREAIGRLQRMGYALFSVSGTGDAYCFIHKRS